MSRLSGIDVDLFEDIIDMSKNTILSLKPSHGMPKFLPFSSKAPQNVSDEYTRTSYLCFIIYHYFFKL